MQVAGTISASPATTANQVPTWGQVQAIAKPYKVYTALLTQTGTNAPVATVLENTLGITISFSYTTVGRYKAVFSTPFTGVQLDKVVAFIDASTHGYGQGGATIKHAIVAANSLDFYSFSNATTLADSFINGTLFEIRLYN